MFKKVLGLLVIFSTSSVFAHQNNYKNETISSVPQTTIVSNSDDISGPYAGAALGIQNAGSYTGLQGKFFAGLGQKFNNNYYLGGELFTDIGSLPLGGSQYANRLTFGFGASLLPGFMLSQNILAYGRLGLKAYRESGIDNLHVGSQVGLGLQTNVAKNWAVRGEYAYSAENLVRNFNRYGSHEVNLGLVYKFN